MVTVIYWYAPVVIRDTSTMFKAKTRSVIFSEYNYKPGRHSSDEVELISESEDSNSGSE